MWPQTVHIPTPENSLMNKTSIERDIMLTSLKETYGTTEILDLPYNQTVYLTRTHTLTQAGPGQPIHSVCPPHNIDTYVDPLIIQKYLRAGIVTAEPMDIGHEPNVPSTCEVAGVFYTEPEQTDALRRACTGRDYHAILLVPEEDNEKDPDAISIRVDLDGTSPPLHVGYVPRHQTPYFRPLIDMPPENYRLSLSGRGMWETAEYPSAILHVATPQRPDGQRLTFENMDSVAPGNQLWMSGVPYPYTIEKVIPALIPGKTCPLYEVKGLAFLPEQNRGKIRHLIVPELIEAETVFCPAPKTNPA